MACSSGVWDKQETRKLIEIWGEDNIQSQLEGCHRNKEVYQRIARKMGEEGFERTFVQCREKVKKLKKEYRKLKDTLNETGQGRNKEVEWPYFELMDRILGHKPTTVPESIVDSLAQSQDSNDSSSEIREVNEVDETLFGENSDTGTTTSTNDTSTIREVSSPAQCKCNKKKKRSRGDQFEVVMNKVMEDLISSQERNEARYLELENKRMRMEEKMYDKEVEMQRESRQFQMQMMQMMSSLVNNQSRQAFPHPLATSTQYPTTSYYQRYNDDYQPYDDDATQL